MANARTDTERAQTVLPEAEPAALGLDPDRLERLYATVEAQIADGRYHGAQLAIARHGKLAAFRTFGQARVDPPTPATDRTLWLLFSQTKPVVGAAIWQLVDQGALSFADRIADHIPEFARRGKGLITVQQVITHQGGFPDATVSPAAWTDHERLRAEVCDFALQWDPGTRMKYHGISAHWVLAALIEAVTGRDYREVIRRDLLDPLGLDDLRVGVPQELQDRCADMHAPGDGPASPGGEAINSPEWRTAGVPGAGGYATAAAMAAFYQLLVGEGQLNGVRVLSPRVVQLATRNHTGERLDEAQGVAMHRGLGVYIRGTEGGNRALGTLAGPRTFGHGGAGSSQSWADPDSGLSFTYLSNTRHGAWHDQRMDKLSNLVHAALIAP
jgi:CubicO group peptidase (beta-lactamase class C family)